MKKKTIKEEIIKALEPEKKYRLTWGETVWYNKEVMGISKKDVAEKFYEGGVDIDSSTDIVDGDMVDDSLEIEEIGL